ncbi:Rieske (2Fe-2S) protein [Labilibacter marinus]|uniref:Rieske (2Fe-2S) protein n=1 Tax=Labilibacter marinus TaxID=1477105 RepID=UPI00082F05E6|nr:Rieske (2Fe-2S) protein [Labilibacter marinus]
MKRIKVCSLDELKQKLKLVVEVGDRKVLMIYHQNTVFAVDNVCPHAKGHLSEGRLEEGSITCLNHGTCFDLRTGKVRMDMIDEDMAEMFEDLDDLPFGPLPTFVAELENDSVFLLWDE